MNSTISTRNSGECPRTCSMRPATHCQSPPAFASPLTVMSSRLTTWCSFIISPKLRLITLLTTIRARRRRLHLVGPRNAGSLRATLRPPSSFQLMARASSAGASQGETSMQRARLIVMTACLLIVVAATGWAQTNGSTATPTVGNDSGRQTPDLAALVRQLAAEVRSLKIELLKFRLESQQAKLAQLEREFEQARTAERQLTVQEQKFNQGLATFDERLGETDLEASERAQLESSKAKMTQNGQQQFHTQRQQVLDQQAEVNQRLANERELWRKLVDKAKELGIKVDESGMK